MLIALLTCQKLPNLTDSDQLLISEFAQHNITAVPAIWNDTTINWSIFDYLIFRNTWDYYEKETEFNNWLQHIDDLKIKTQNLVQTINQNKHKFYLQNLQQHGFSILPTVFINKTNDLNISQIIPKHWTKAVIKPAFSAGSYQTEVFEIAEIDQTNQQFQPIAAQKDLLLQQFMPEIVTEGETSFIFFNKKFSHAVNKKPKPGDFRIQIAFGGKYTEVNPSKDLINQAQQIVNTFDENLLYARVDTIIIDNKIHLMEIECIEPDLYFNVVPYAITKFVNAFLEIINR